MFRKVTFFFAIIMFGLPSITSASTPIIVKVAVNEYAAKYYQSQLKQKHKKAVEFTAIDIKSMGRDVISLIIFVQALDRAGLAVNFEFVSSPNPQRNGALVQSGAVLLSMRTFAEGYTPKDTLKSSPLLDSEHSLRGVFGLKSNHALMKVKTLEELREFSAVTNHAWKNEIKFLQGIGLPKLELSHSRESIFKHIAFRNIDFTILALTNSQSPDLQIRFADITLVPVPGLLIMKKNTYQFIIAENHPDGQRVHQTLEKGLGMMREQGLIKKYFQQLIPHRSDLPNWKILNQADADENDGS